MLSIYWILYHFIYNKPDAFAAFYKADNDNYSIDYNIINNKIVLSNLILFYHTIYLNNPCAYAVIPTNTMYM